MSRLALLEERVWDLLHRALALYHDHPQVTDVLQEQVRRFDEPLRVAVAGPWQAGKSTLVSALVGEEVAPVAAGSEVLTWYRDGTPPYAVAYPPGQELAISRSARGITLADDGWRPGAVTDIVVTWPARTLRHTTLLDTPAVPADEDSGQPAAVLRRVLHEADTVLYLTRDLREADLRMLSAPWQGTVAQAAPVTLLLLSRADEIGGGRIDALLAARQLARRRSREPRVRARCLGVVAVSGLVALAGRVLSEAEYADLAALATRPREELAELLLSTDRFVDPAVGVPVPAAARRGLLDRLGLAGVRLATTLIRGGRSNRATLAAELVQRSGLTELREALAGYCSGRREALKARSALVALESVLRKQPRPGAGALLTELERALATAHDFRELRLLAAVQSQRLGFDAELAAKAHRLAGGDGTSVTARLGVEDNTPTSELWRLQHDALARWQSHAEDPLFTLDQRRAARVLVRSCEQIAALLS